MVPLPAGDEVEMEVVGDAGAGGRAQVEADVDTVRPQVAFMTSGRKNPTAVAAMTFRPSVPVMASSGLDIQARKVLSILRTPSSTRDTRWQYNNAGPARYR